MKKLIDKINEKENLILTICVLIIAACIIFFIIVFAKEKEKKDTFIFKDNLDEQVLSISATENSTTINLREFSYYIIVAESNTQEQALFFKEETPVNYWELKTAPLENVRFLTKKFCIETCIKDNILYMKALENDITLTDDETSYMKDISYEIYTNLTGDQVDITNIELNDIIKVQEKIFLAEKYLLSLIENGTIKERQELSVDGTYYLEEIKPQYNIKEFDSLLNKLVFGSITVNVVKE